MGSDSILLCQFLILGIVASSESVVDAYNQGRKTKEQEAIDAEFERLKQLRKTASYIIKESKKDAHVDTGRLKRSINYVIALDGVFTFTEVFYGQFHDNSKLEENIKQYWDSNEPFNLIYTDDNGQPYQTVKRYKSGRTSVNVVPNKKAAKAINDTLGRYGLKQKIGSVRDFIKRIKEINSGKLLR